MAHMPCFSIGGMKILHDAILESFETTKGVIISLTRLPSTTYSLLSSSLFSQVLNSILLVISLSEVMLNQILT